MAIVNHGFRILNLVHFVFQSQQTFGKMGRYYIQYEQIISLFVQYLQDFNLFNNFINRSVNLIIIQSFKLETPRSNKKQKKKKGSNYEVQINLPLKSTDSQSIANLRSLQNEKTEEAKHFFLYVNQCQKVADRLYEFYHNRYYFRVVKQIIKFPAFLIIQNREYYKLIDSTRKVDRKLVHLVRMSKYDRQEKTESHSCIKTSGHESRVRHSQTMPFSNKHYDTEAGSQKYQQQNSNPFLMGQFKDQYTIEQDIE